MEDWGASCKDVRVYWQLAAVIKAEHNVTGRQQACRPFLKITVFYLHREPRRLIDTRAGEFCPRKAVSPLETRTLDLDQVEPAAAL